MRPCAAAPWRAASSWRYRWAAAQVSCRAAALLLQAGAGRSRRHTHRPSCPCWRAEDEPFRVSLTLPACLARGALSYECLRIRIRTSVAVASTPPQGRVLSPGTQKRTHTPSHPALSSVPSRRQPQLSCAWHVLHRVLCWKPAIHSLPCATFMDACVCTLNHRPACSIWSHPHKAPLEAGAAALC